MKKIIAPTIFLALLAAVSLLGIGVWRQSALNATSEEFAIATTLAIVAEGPGRLLESATEEYRQLRSLQDATKSFEFTRNILGEAEEIQSVSGSALVPLYYFSATAPTADYRFVVKYERNTADVEIDIIYRGEQWFVTKFEVVSNLLSD